MIVPLTWLKITNRKSFHEEIKSKLKSRNGCYHSVQNLFSSWLLPKNLKIKIHKSTILPNVLYGCETWSLTLREERRLTVFESNVLRRIFGSRRDEVMGDLRKLHKEELNDLYSSPNIVLVIKSRRVRQAERITHIRRAERRIAGFGGETWGKETTVETQV